MKIGIFLFQASLPPATNQNLPDLASLTSPSASATPAPLMDSVWVETVNKKAALKLEKLDTDLKNYKSNSIKVNPLSSIYKSYYMILYGKIAELSTV